MRDESWGGRQAWPKRLAVEALGVAAAQKPPELANHGEVHRDADGLSVGPARQPGEHRLVDAPPAPSSCPGKQEPIEASQHELSARVAVTASAREREKGGRFACERAREIAHRGTGRPTVRSRRSATRTYTEVDAGRR